MNKKAAAQLTLGAATFVALRWFGVLTGWQNIPTPLGPVGITGDQVQLALSIAAGLSPDILEKFGVVTWLKDLVAAPGLVKEIHANTKPASPPVEPQP